MSGEATSSKNIDTEAWEVILQIILEDFDPKDVFNADETGLFLQVPAEQVLEF